MQLCNYFNMVADVLVLEASQYPVWTQLPASRILILSGAPDSGGVLVRVLRSRSAGLQHTSLLRSLDYLCLPFCPRRIDIAHVGVRM